MGGGRKQNFLEPGKDLLQHFVPDPLPIEVNGKIPIYFSGYKMKSLDIMVMGAIEKPYKDMLRFKSWFLASSFISPSAARVTQEPVWNRLIKVTVTHSSGFHLPFL